MPAADPNRPDGGLAPATASQLWFIRAHARGAGLTPDQLRDQAADAGREAHPSTHQGQLHRNRGVPLTIRLASRLITWSRYNLDTLPEFDADADPRPCP